MDISLTISEQLLGKRQLELDTLLVKLSSVSLLFSKTKTFIFQHDFDSLRDKADFDLYLLLKLKLVGNMMIWLTFIT